MQLMPPVLLLVAGVHLLAVLLMAVLLLVAMLLEIGFTTLRQVCLGKRVG